MLLKFIPITFPDKICMLGKHEQRMKYDIAKIKRGVSLHAVVEEYAYSCALVVHK